MGIVHQRAKYEVSSSIGSKVINKTLKTKVKIKILVGEGPAWPPAYNVLIKSRLVPNIGMYLTYIL